MAGGKESPRQKLVGLMYLILTVCLALNVSGSVLEKFLLHSNTLEKINSFKIHDNNEVLAHIQSTVSGLGNRKNDVEIFEKAKSIRNKSQEVVDFIQAIKKKLIEISGGLDPKTGSPKSLKFDVSNFMLFQKNAEKIEIKLNEYIEFIKKNSGVKLPPIALKSSDVAFLKNDPNQKGKDFANLNYDHATLSEALATMDLHISEVLMGESIVLANISKEIGADDVKFDTFKIVLKPKSQYVASGSKYEAEMFLSASSSSIKPDMYIGGKQLDVKEGIGNVSFPVSAKSYDKEGISKQSFQATIKLNNGGKEILTKADIEYFVVKPSIQVQAASVQALYLNCGNELNIQIPVLGTYYNPKFNVTGGTFKVGEKKGYIVVTPKEKDVKVSVYNGSDFIDDLNYKVRTVPKPIVRLTNGAGAALDEVNGMKIAEVRLINVKIIPDESFSAFLPNDSKYKVVEWEVTLARGSERKAFKKVQNEESLNLTSIISNAAPNDRLIVEIKKVVRINFMGLEEVVMFPTVNVKNILLK
jgi:gliding motility-associated protein GldM